MLPPGYLCPRLWTLQDRDPVDHVQSYARRCSLDVLAYSSQHYHKFIR